MRNCDVLLSGLKAHELRLERLLADTTVTTALLFPGRCFFHVFLFYSQFVRGPPDDGCMSSMLLLQVQPRFFPKSCSQ
jgi:hypothetical protein